VTEVVRLRLPAGRDFGRVARVTTAALARRHGFSYREVEDLRLAVDEAIIALLDEDDPALGIGVRYEVDEAQLRITLDGSARLDADAAARFRTLVTGLVDTCTLDQDRGEVLLLKTHGHP
jgi:hypothetical protein